MCVHLDKLSYETPWAKTQLGPQQAIKSGAYSDDSELADTMSQQKSLTFSITAIGNSYKVTHAQLFINQTSFRDSIFSPTDSITITWEIDFTGRINTQNILIQATDEHEMIATQTKKIYIE